MEQAARDREAELAAAAAAAAKAASAPPAVEATPAEPPPLGPELSPMSPEELALAGQEFRPEFEWFATLNTTELRARGLPFLTEKQRRYFISQQHVRSALLCGDPCSG